MARSVENETSPPKQRDRQYIWIIRYGLTEFPLKEGVGPYDSDLDPNEGIEHANAIAERISTEKHTKAPNLIYSSPFLRTARTAHILSTRCKTKVRIEEGLTEWQTPSLLVDPSGNRTVPRSLEQLSKMFETIDSRYGSVNPFDNTNNPAAPRFPESEEALLRRCAHTLEKLLEGSEGENLAIVSHAPCDQAIAFALEGAETPKESILGPWPLGGITLFSTRLGSKTWELELYGDSGHMPGCYKPGTKLWSLPCFPRV